MYGPPLVNLTCSNEEYAAVTSLPTGYLSANEMLNNLFVIDCKLYWTCTNASGTDYHQVTLSYIANYISAMVMATISNQVIHGFRNFNSYIISVYIVGS